MVPVTGLCHWPSLALLSIGVITKAYIVKNFKELHSRGLGEKRQIINSFLFVIIGAYWRTIINSTSYSRCCLWHNECTAKNEHSLHFLVGTIWPPKIVLWPYQKNMQIMCHKNATVGFGVVVVILNARSKITILWLLIKHCSIIKHAF